MNIEIAIKVTGLLQIQWNFGDDLSLKWMPAQSQTGQKRQTRLPAMRIVSSETKVAPPHIDHRPMEKREKADEQGATEHEWGVALLQSFAAAIWFSPTNL